MQQVKSNQGSFNETHFYGSTNATLFVNTLFNGVSQGKEKDATIAELKSIEAGMHEDNKDTEAMKGSNYCTFNKIYKKIGELYEFLIKNKNFLDQIYQEVHREFTQDRYCQKNYNAGITLRITEIIDFCQEGLSVKFNKPSFEQYWANFMGAENISSFIRSMEAFGNEKQFNTIFQNGRTLIAFKKKAQDLIWKDPLQGGDFLSEKWYGEFFNQYFIATKFVQIDQYDPRSLMRSFKNKDDFDSMMENLEDPLKGMVNSKINQWISTQAPKGLIFKEEKWYHGYINNLISIEQQRQQQQRQQEQRQQEQRQQQKEYNLFKEGVLQFIRGDQCSDMQNGPTSWGFNILSNNRINQNNFNVAVQILNEDFKNKFNYQVQELNLQTKFDSLRNYYQQQKVQEQQKQAQAGMNKFAQNITTGQNNQRQTFYKQSQQQPQTTNGQYGYYCNQNNQQQTNNLTQSKNMQNNQQQQPNTSLLANNLIQSKKLYQKPQYNNNNLPPLNQNQFSQNNGKTNQQQKNASNSKDDPFAAMGRQHNLGIAKILQENKEQINDKQGKFFKI